MVKSVRHLEDEVATLEARFGAALGPGTRMLATAAPQHLYGLLFRVLWPLAAGRPFLRTPLLHPEELVPTMDEGDFALASTPLALRRLAERAELTSRAAQCRAVFSSGGPLEAGVARRVADALGAPPYEVYGSTETGGIAVRQQWAGDEAWQPLPGVTTALDPETERLVVTSPFVSGGEPADAGCTRLATGDRRCHRLADQARVGLQLGALVGGRHYDRLAGHSRSWGRANVGDTCTRTGKAGLLGHRVLC